jgi:uncharacterized damage-inducible protein DinB
MQLKDHVRLMAEYNRWMNQKLFDSCEQLTAEQLAENKGAFFGSIIGTLNHIAVGDTIWLQRFSSGLNAYPQLDPVAALPQPMALDSILFSQLNELKMRRQLLDQTLLAFADAVKDDDLQKTVTYKNFKGVSLTKPLFGLLMHVFNHQTHHRGQITTLLSQCGIDVGQTDLVVML